MILNDCAIDKNDNWLHSLLSDNKIKIKKFKIENSPTDLGGINLNQLKNLKELNLFNTTTRSLKRKLFSDVPNLKKLVIQNNVHLKMAEHSFLKYSRLKILIINGIHLNPNESNTFFKNLTGDVKISHISVLDWSYNNFVNLKKEILTNFRRVDTLALKHSSIKNVDDNIFHHLNIKYLHLEGNYIKNLPQKIFEPLFMNKYTEIYLYENQITRDCHLKTYEFMIKYKNDNDDNIICEKSENFQRAIKKKSNKFSNFCHIDEFINDDDDDDDNKEKFQIEIIRPDLMAVNLKEPLKNFTLRLMEFSNFPREKNSHCVWKNKKKIFFKIVSNVHYVLCLNFRENPSSSYTNYCLPFTNRALKKKTKTNKQSFQLLILSITFSILFIITLGALLMVIFSKNKPKGIISKNEERIKLENLSNKSRESSLNKNCSDKPLSMNLRFSYPKHSESSDSFETLSTVSYVSANQPNQMELLNYKLNKLRETFQNVK